MQTVGLLVRMEAKPGKEQEVEHFLRAAPPLIRHELGTISWYALRIGTSTFGIFGTFVEQLYRETHLAGEFAAALMAQAPDLFVGPPTIEKVDIIATKQS